MDEVLELLPNVAKYITDGNGLTLIHAAIKNKFPELINHLQRAGVDINITDE